MVDNCFIHIYIRKGYSLKLSQTAVHQIMIMCVFVVKLFARMFKLMPAQLKFKDKVYFQCFVLFCFYFVFVLFCFVLLCFILQETKVCWVFKLNRNAYTVVSRSHSATTP